MIKFYPTYASKLSIVDLAGLSSETIIAGNAACEALASLAKTALDNLIAADNIFREKLITAHGSTLTEQIKELDRQRGADMREVWRMSKAAAKGSDADRAAAGQLLVPFLKPYHNAPAEALMSETSTLQYLRVQYEENLHIREAAAVLLLDTVFARLFSANEQLSILWNKRADEEAAKNGNYPSNRRKELERCYSAFCNVVIQSLRLQPTDALKHLFSVMNEIRVKYHHSQPVRLNNSNTSVDAIPAQPYTGEAITPVPHVLVKSSDGAVDELRFTVDYNLTYRNNVDVGEAKVIIRGKGRYTGTYFSTFHIEPQTVNSC
jgi:hypothetical protein